MAATVLIAHGNTQSLRLAVEDLQRVGLRVIATPDGGDAFARFFEDVPDLVVCSNNLPSLSGPNFARMVRSQSPDTPVVILEDSPLDEPCEGAILLPDPLRIEALHAALPEIVPSAPPDPSSAAPAQPHSTRAVFIKAALKRYQRGNNMLALLDDAGIQQMASIAEHQVRKAGELVIRQGDPGDGFYFVVEGQVRVTLQEQDDEEVARINAGGFFGEMALLNDQPRSASVWTVGPATLLWFSREAFLPLLDTYGSLREVLSGVALQRTEENLWRVLFDDDEVHQSFETIAGSSSDTTDEPADEGDIEAALRDDITQVAADLEDAERAAASEAFADSNVGEGEAGPPVVAGLTEDWADSEPTADQPVTGPPESLPVDEDGVTGDQLVAEALESEQLEHEPPAPGDAAAAAAPLNPFGDESDEGAPIATAFGVNVSAAAAAAGSSLQAAPPGSSPWLGRGFVAGSIVGLVVGVAATLILGGPATPAPGANSTAGHRTQKATAAATRPKGESPSKQPAAPGAPARPGARTGALPASAAVHATAAPTAGGRAAAATQAGSPQPAAAPQGAPTGPAAAAAPATGSAGASPAANTTGSKTTAGPSMSAAQEAQRKKLRKQLFAAYKHGDFAGATKAGEALQKGFHIDWEALLALGNAQRQSGHANLAVATYRSFIAEYPKNAYADTARYWLAEILRARGKKDAAKALYQQLAQNPKSKYSAKAKARLGKSP